MRKHLRVLVDGCAGALAFSRSGDPATGEFSDADSPIPEGGDAHMEDDLSDVFTHP
jgi:hypothetical protein